MGVSCWVEVKRTIDGLRLLQEGACDGDGLHGLVCGLRPDGLEGGTVNRCPCLGSNEHGNVPWVGMVAHFG